MPFSDDEAIRIEPLSKLKSLTCIVSMLLFVCSLFTTAFCTKESCRIGIEALLGGPFALAGGKSGISWLANPFLWAAWVLLIKNKKITWLFSFIASLCSVSFLCYKEIIKNEAGIYETITTISIGYWLWLASCMACFTGTVITATTNQDK